MVLCIERPEWRDLLSQSTCMPAALESIASAQVAKAQRPEPTPTERPATCRQTAAQQSSKGRLGSAQWRLCEAAAPTPPRPREARAARPLVRKCCRPLMHPAPPRRVPAHFANILMLSASRDHVGDPEEQHSCCRCRHGLKRFRAAHKRQQIALSVCEQPGVQSRWPDGACT